MEKHVNCNNTVFQCMLKWQSNLFLRVPFFKKQNISCEFKCYFNGKIQFHLSLCGKKEVCISACFPFVFSVEMVSV